MRTHPYPYLVAAALALALAACRPGAAEYTDAEAPKAVQLDNASANIALRFAPGSSRLFAHDAARLRALAASGAIAPTDRVTVVASGAPALAAVRFETVAAELLRYGIVANRGPYGAAPPNRAVVETGRYLVTLPPCPNWSKQASLDFTNNEPSNFGCATATDLGLSVWNPADLAEGRPVGLADAQTAVTAVNNYRQGKVQLPTAAPIGPIAQTAAPTPAGPSGSQP